MNMSEITIPISLQLTPQSRALIDAILQAGKAPEPAAPAAFTTPPIPGAYWPGQGGIYCGVLPAIGDQPAQHMVFSVAEAEELTWGPYGTEAPCAKSRNDGRANTQALLALHESGPDREPKYPAAKWAADHTADGHQDFHLPSQAELFMASLHAPKAFKKEGWYWSSTQHSASNAFIQDFEGGGSDWASRDGKFRVRAVRWIPL